MLQLLKSRAVLGLLVILCSVGLSNCTVHHHHTPKHKHKHGRRHLPPGHDKKIHGDRSAKRHSRGHNGQGQNQQ